MALRLGPACYHGRKGYLPAAHPRYGQPCEVVKVAGRNRPGAERHPANVLVRFADGVEMVTSAGCIKYVCKCGEGSK